MKKLFWVFDYEQYLPIFVYCEALEGRWYCRVLKTTLSSEEVFDNRISCIAAALVILRAEHAAVRREIQKLSSLNYEAAPQLKVVAGQ